MHPIPGFDTPVGMPSQPLVSVSRVVMWLIYGGAAVVVAPILCLIGLFALWSDYTFSHDQAEASATIVAKDAESQTITSGKGPPVTYYYLRFKWTLPENGHEQISRVQVKPDRWAASDVGQSIAVLYRKSNPNDARLPGYSSVPIAVFCLVAGGVLFAVGRGLLAWNRKRFAQQAAA